MVLYVSGDFCMYSESTQRGTMSDCDTGFLEPLVRTLWKGTVLHLLPTQISVFFNLFLCSTYWPLPSPRRIVSCSVCIRIAAFVCHGISRQQNFSEPRICVQIFVGFIAICAWVYVCYWALCKLALLQQESQVFYDSLSLRKLCTVYAVFNSENSFLYLTHYRSAAWLIKPFINFVAVARW